MFSCFVPWTKWHPGDTAIAQLGYDRGLHPSVIPIITSVGLFWGFCVFSFLFFSFFFEKFNLMSILRQWYNIVFLYDFHHDP